MGFRAGIPPILTKTKFAKHEALHRVRSSPIMRDVCQAGSSKLGLVGAEHRQLHPCAWGATASFIHSHASERAAVQRVSFYKSDAGTFAPGWRGNQRPPFAKLTALSRFPFGGGALTGERLLNARRSQGVGWLDAVKQPIRTGFKKLRKPGERCQRYGIIAPLNVADRLPMYAHQLSQALLSQVGLQPGVSNLLADQSEHLSICHTSSWNAYTPLLTPRIDSVKSWPSSCKRPAGHSATTGSSGTVLVEPIRKRLSNGENFAAIATSTLRVLPQSFPNDSKV